MITDPVEQFLSILPFHPDPYQMDAIRALSDGRSVLVAAPTGTGKTVVAEYAVHLALARGLRALYTTPIKALSNQKYRDFRARYGDQVGLLTGDLVENPRGRLLVMTTEVARNILVQDPNSFQDVGCLVFDEVHYLADPERGTAWEESILLAPIYVPLVCLSATVANAEEIAEWIRTTGRDVALIESFERSVPLKHRYYLEGTLYPILEGDRPQAVVGTWGRGDRDTGNKAAGTTGANGHRNGHRSRDADLLQPRPPDVVRALDDAGLLPGIYFLFSRKAVEAAAESCMPLKLLPYRHSAEVRRIAQERLAGLPAEDRTLTQVERLLALLPKGIGFHHAGMLPPLKTLVEELLAAGRLKVVFATDTLALGINVPARSVVVGEMTKFDGQLRRPLSPGEYRQLTGRAGRRGMDPVGYSILLDSPWVGIERAMETAIGAVAPLESAFRPGYGTVLNLLQQGGDEDRLSRLISGSLRQFQEDGKLRRLAEERERIAGALASLPSHCPICGEPSQGLEQEKRLRREQGRAEAAVEAAFREKALLEERIGAWPWQYGKSQRKQWLRDAPYGAVAYSRRHGWTAYLGPSREGIGSFFLEGGVAPLPTYADLDYLPDPPVTLELPESVSRRSHLVDGVAEGIDRREIDQLAAALERLGLPDLESTAQEVKAAAQVANAGALAALDERAAAAAVRRREVALALAQNPYLSCPHRPQHRRAERDRRHLSGLLAAQDKELDVARKEASRRAHRIVRSLRSVLESFGYLAGGQPTRKAAALMRIFDSNALILSELLDWGILADLSAPELAEVASWFAFDKDGAGRALATTERLARARGAVDAATRQVLEVERRNGLSLSHALPQEFRGVALGWATGARLADLSARSGLAEGDIVFTLQKAIDLCRQIGQAAPRSRTPSLARRAAEAERLLRRGVVDSYYRWVVGDSVVSDR
ncbi:MAG: DEAD/DEAH box helicase [Chloroflexota bacterium]